ncbi:toxin-antitoxin system, toxin component, RelE domain protein [Leptospira vanthielii serovar Holland str. Waz Holland = ATCC 700522]|uniref:Toxin-antitoxin system, toxin component, RelE domain protein n=1 Tax=Leptospira vanthielii serovar Holland str. Waz Holland = ATCC 700522 TaxID=1218591 RepID=N1WEC5_9LEPT|nr:type II toxin-antitoxin system RelE/ParE family toxin [Leptospira vanthielii]EMY71745.1 toxin-antitoxin system, toxin component, RelE domain protein [Leptospira vanthielii serovar Holland str. Waz Holland = ATCC 700522]
MRIKQGSNICRFLYFFEKDATYIITSGFIKKDQKTDRDQLAKAKLLMNQYKENNK